MTLNLMFRLCQYSLRLSVQRVQGTALSVLSSFCFFCFGDPFSTGQEVKKTKTLKKTENEVEVGTERTRT